jgi:WD40 repeat protein/serine/threonine protein kinase
MRNCPPAEYLAAFLDESIDAAEASVLAQHLESCPACQKSLERLTSDAGNDTWRRLRVPETPTADEPRPGFLRRLEHMVPEANTLVYSPPENEDRDRAAPRSGQLPSPAGYEILEKRGRGGIGVVYKARDLRLKRIVALKMLLTGADASANEKDRLRIEAESVARFQHPNIVQIYEIGEHEGRPFLALEFVAGGSLADQLDGTPQPSAVSASLVETVARATHYAHQHGVVHRDLKPGNILLQVESRNVESHQAEKDPSGLGASTTLRLGDVQPKIADFGLAKRLDEASHTQTGEVLGTPGYMAPEQARGQSKTIGPAADVYALGAILYQLLTGRPPFQGVTPVETIVQVLHDDPVPPRRLQPQIPIDLETICLKCLAKEPRQRYASALDLAEDLRRFQAGESIRARRVGPLLQGWRWCRRNPGPAGLLTALALTLFAGVAGVTWGLVRAETARGREAAARQLEAEQRERAEVHLYQSRIALAEREWEMNNVARAEYLLDLCAPVDGATDRRGWEWHYLKRLCRADQKTIQAHRAPLSGLAVSRDGKYLASSAGDRGYQNNPRQIPGELTLWATSDFRKLADLTGHTGRVDGVTFDRSCTRLASVSADQTLRIWGIPSGHPRASFPVTTQRFWQGTTTAFSPDDKTLAAPGPENRNLRLINAPTGATDAVLNLGGEWVSACAFSSDGALLAAGVGEPAQLVVWNVAERRELYRHTTVYGPPAAAFSLDNRLLAVAPGGADVLILEAGSGRTVTTLRGHAGKVYDVAWSPDGQFLASGAADRTARIWRVNTWNEYRTLRGHTTMVLRIAYHPDGKLVTGDENGMLKVWDPTSDQRFTELPGAQQVKDLAFSADGRQVRALTNVALRAWDLATRRTVFDRVPEVALRTEWPLQYVALSPDGRLLAAPDRKDRSVVRVWNVETNQTIWTLTGHRAGVRSIAFAPGSRFLATASGEKAAAESRELILWKLPEQGQGEPTRTDLPCEAPVQSLAFIADGSRLVAGERGLLTDGMWKDGHISIWDTATGRQVRRWAAHPGTVQSVAIDPAGRWVASGGRSSDQSVRVWKTDTGELLHQLLGPESHTCIAFNPDGTRLAAVGYEGTVHLWDPATGLDLLTLRGQPLPEGIACDARVVFSPDGTQLAVNSWTGSIHIWDARPLTDK